MSQVQWPSLVHGRHSDGVKAGVWGICSYRNRRHNVDGPMAPRGWLRCQASQTNLHGRQRVKQQVVRGWHEGPVRGAGMRG